MTRRTRVIPTVENVLRPIGRFGGESAVHYHVKMEFENNG